MHTGKFLLHREKKDFTATFCLLHEDLASLKKHINMLHPEEKAHFDTLKFEKRQADYLLGRIAAKTAVKGLTSTENIQSWHIDSGIFEFPIVKSLHNANIQVSISHCGKIGIALAFPEAHPMGIDIEKVNPNRLKAIESQITEKERTFMSESTLPYLQVTFMIWTMKEALSKVIKTGLMIDFKLLEIDSFQQEDDQFVCTFSHFGQYKAITYYANEYTCSIVLPKNTKPELKQFHEAFIHTVTQNIAS